MKLTEAKPRGSASLFEPQKHSILAVLTHIFRNI